MGLIQEAFAVPPEDPDGRLHVERPYTENVVDDEPADGKPEQPGFYATAGAADAVRVTDYGGTASTTSPRTASFSTSSRYRHGASLLMGVLSDTHGWLDSAIVELFAGVDHIIHAGDVEEWSVLRELGALAPLTVVRGNCDKAGWAGLPESATATFDGVTLHVRHDLVMIEALDATLLAAMRGAGGGVVICGHSHLPAIERKDGVLFLNPGSASRPGDAVHRSVALLRIERGECTAEIHELRRDVPVSR
jgi:putative phosphoesterase